MSLNTKRKEKDTLRWLLKVFVRMLNKEESEKIVIFFSILLSRLLGKFTLIIIY